MALAQTAPPNPITGMSVHKAQDSTRTLGWSWDTWEAELSFAFDAAIVINMKSGDYSDFSIQGPLSSYSASSVVPVTYNFNIESQNQVPLFNGGCY